MSSCKSPLIQERNKSKLIYVQPINTIDDQLHNKLQKRDRLSIKLNKQLFIPKMLVIIDGPMINEFIDDVDYFRKCTDDLFHDLDIDGTGLLSRTNLRPFFTPWFALDAAAKNCDLVFNTFDVDGNGSIDREEFRPMMMEIYIAIARGIGSTPVNIAVEEGSLLVRVYEHELGRKSSDGKVNGSGWKKFLRKKSKKTLTRCGCSGRCFGGNFA